MSKWNESYAKVPELLKSMKDVGGVVSAFNANIDAVKKVHNAEFSSWLQAAGCTDVEGSGESVIAVPADLLRGFLYCFERGIAQEWLVTDETCYRWMEKNVGYDRLQMGGQGGIIGNVMAVCGVERVYVHGASMPKLQTELFVDRPNLLSIDSEGSCVPARTIDRSEDTALVHWILEFDKGDTITVGAKTYTCPKSNRFIATYDPANFRLGLDGQFCSALEREKIDVTLLAGYQMLTQTLATGEKSIDRIRESIAVVESWKVNSPGQTVHFEFASTQDKEVRTELLKEMGSIGDSVGCNEQELIDLMEVTGNQELAEECKKDLSSVPLFKALRKLFDTAGVERIQLHMFGLYVTIQKKEWKISPEATRNGMALAATIAASKAGTGSIEREENLLWAVGKEVGDIPRKELNDLAVYLQSELGADSFAETGIFEGDAFDVIAIPTIIVENPVTLVGMGDTISSISLVGAREL